MRLSQNEVIYLSMSYCWGLGLLAVLGSRLYVVWIESKKEINRPLVLFFLYVLRNLYYCPTFLVGGVTTSVVAGPLHKK